MRKIKLKVENTNYICNKITFVLNNEKDKKNILIMFLLLRKAIRHPKEK